LRVIKKSLMPNGVNFDIITSIAGLSPIGIKGLGRIFVKGSSHLLKEKLKSTFIVSNADIIVEADYADIVKCHQKDKNKITLVCSMKHFPIPYGVVHIENGGSLKRIREKPEMDYLVLTGLYVVEPDVIPLIPRDREFHMTDLINKLQLEGQKIGVYPVADKAWMDIGELEAYQEVLKRFQ